jgi:hypothetical protein
MLKSKAVRYNKPLKPVNSNGKVVNRTASMSQIQAFHQKAMDLAEAAAVARLRGAIEQAVQLTRQAFEQEFQAAILVASNLDAEPTRSVLQRSAASLAIECGELQAAERLIATALSGILIIVCLRRLLFECNTDQARVHSDRILH